MSVQGGAYTILRDLIVKASRLAQGLEQLYDLHFDAVDRQVQTGLCSNCTSVKRSCARLPFQAWLSFLFMIRFSLGCRVIPQEEGSLLYVAVIRRSGRDRRVSCETRSDLDLIDIIESWMVRQTDHWFIRPSVWNSIPADRQVRLCLKCLPNTCVGESYDLSIPDDLRRTALDVPVDIALSPAHKIKLEEQLRKIA